MSADSEKSKNLHNLIYNTHTETGMLKTLCLKFSYVPLPKTVAIFSKIFSKIIKLVNY